MAALNAAQVAQFTTAAEAKLSTAQIGAISTAAISGLTGAEVTAFTFADVAALNSAQVKAMTHGPGEFADDGEHHRFDDFRDIGSGLITARGADHLG